MEALVLTWPAVEGWSVAAEDSIPRVLLLDPGADFEAEVERACEVLDEELATPILPIYGDDGSEVVALLDLLRRQVITATGTRPAPDDLLADAAAAIDELLEQVMVTAEDEALVERLGLGLGLSPTALARALRSCWEAGHLPVALPVCSDGLGRELIAAWMPGSAH